MLPELTIAETENRNLVLEPLTRNAAPAVSRTDATNL
jgi:mannose-1-phosphate guanylyltransferase